jgi:hypothetical protein
MTTGVAKCGRARNVTAARMPGHGHPVVERGRLPDEADAGELLGVAGRHIAEHSDAARGGDQQADGEVEQGGFAGPVRPDKADDPAAGMVSEQPRRPQTFP